VKISERTAAAVTWQFLQGFLGFLQFSVCSGGVFWWILGPNPPLKMTKKCCFCRLKFKEPNSFYLDSLGKGPPYISPFLFPSLGAPCAPPAPQLYIYIYTCVFIYIYIHIFIYRYIYVGGSGGGWLGAFGWEAQLGSHAGATQLGSMHLWGFFWKSCGFCMIS
jgi:hypothetical protein